VIGWDLGGWHSFSKTDAIEGKHAARAAQGLFANVLLHVVRHYEVAAHNILGEFSVVVTNMGRFGVRFHQQPNHFQHPRLVVFVIVVIVIVVRLVLVACQR